MSFIPNTDTDRAEMLKAVGLRTVADLFHDVPASHRFPHVDLPAALSEQEVLRELDTLSRRNAEGGSSPSFLGAGAYRHFIPSIVDAVVSRSEFATAYTPYQPEISQGTLQAIFEYQSMICRLTGMEVSNASHYDGATSTAEAAIMALNVAQGTRRGVILSAGVHPQYRAVVRTYTQGVKLEIRGDDADTSAEDLAGLCDSSTACVIVQNPDFFGRIMPPGSMAALARKVHDCGALLVSVVNPVALGVLVPPGDLGVDVAVGEGQALGNTLSFGGPYLGFFAFRREHVRKSSGRIAGETVDRTGRRGFVFTLSTREQHIRREKATSNICTNQSLNALAAAVYLAALGPRGLRQIAELCWHKAHYAAKSISKIRGYTVGTTGESNGAGGFFHEFVVRCPLPADEINRRLFQRHGIIGGYALGAELPDRKNDMIFCCTEMNTREEIDLLAASLLEVGNA